MKKKFSGNKGRVTRIYISSRSLQSPNDVLLYSMLYRSRSTMCLPFRSKARDYEVYINPTTRVVRHFFRLDHFASFCVLIEGVMLFIDT